MLSPERIVQHVLPGDTTQDGRTAGVHATPQELRWGGALLVVLGLFIVAGAVV